jgi:hypothetical protein
MILNNNQIFNYIEYNNFEELELLINKKYNIINKNKLLLLYISVKYRAKECFDLLLDSNIIIENVPYYLNPLYLAIEYYINAPNNSNKYYIYKLLKIDFFINNKILVLALENYDLFNDLFNKYFYKIKKTDYDIFCENICKKNKLDILNLIYNKIINNNELLNYLFNKLLKYAIYYNNFLIILFLEKNNFDFTLIDNKPSIYFIINNFTEKNKIICNYLFHYYQQKSIKDINNIPNIYLFHSNYIFKNFLKNINNILSLNLNFNKIINNLLLLAFDKFLLNNNDNYNNLLIIICIIKKNKNINNIFNESIINIVYNKNLLNLLCVIENFKINVNNNIKNDINLIIPTNINFNMYKNKYIKYINYEISNNETI